MYRCRTKELDMGNGRYCRSRFDRASILGHSSKIPPRYSTLFSFPFFPSFFHLIFIPSFPCHTTHENTAFRRSGGPVQEQHMQSPPFTEPRQRVYNPSLV